MRRPTDEEMRFREILSYIVYDGYGWRGESMLAVAEKLLEETAWMVEPADPTERLWEWADKALAHVQETIEGNKTTIISFMSADDWIQLKQLVEERKKRVDDWDPEKVKVTIAGPGRSTRKLVEEQKRRTGNQ